jgi:hypothetical protein
VLGRARGQPEQRHDGVLSDSGHRRAHDLPAAPSALSFEIRVLHRQIDGVTSISPSPAVGGPGRVGAPATSSHGRWESV